MPGVWSRPKDTGARGHDGHEVWILTITFRGHSFPKNKKYLYKMREVVAVVRQLLENSERHPLAIPVAAHFFGNAKLQGHHIRSICRSPANQIFKNFKDLYPEQFHQYETNKNHPPRPPIPEQIVNLRVPVKADPQGVLSVQGAGILSKVARRGELTRDVISRVLQVLHIRPPNKKGQKTEEGRQTNEKEERQTSEKEEGQTSAKPEETGPGWWRIKDGLGIREPYQKQLWKETDSIWEHVPWPQHEVGTDAFSLNRDSPFAPQETGGLPRVPSESISDEVLSDSDSTDSVYRSLPEALVEGDGGRDRRGAVPA